MDVKFYMIYSCMLPDPFDLFGTVEHTQKPKSTPTSKKQNPFHPKYDPFSNIWAEDEEPHFW